MFHYTEAATDKDGPLEMPVQIKLRDSKYQFYLTGSRYFGNTTAYSDWDFFVEWTLECEAFLRDIGFQGIHNSAYKDVQMVKLMRYKVPEDIGIPDLQIDVQMVRDAGLKQQAQAYIFSQPNLLRLYHSLKFKGEKDMLWDLVYSAANGLLYTGALNDCTARPNRVNLQNILTNFCEAPFGYGPVTPPGEGVCKPQGYGMPGSPIKNDIPF